MQNQTWETHQDCDCDIVSGYITLIKAKPNLIIGPSPNSQQVQAME